ncbi:MAG: small ribosomal subunit Rsm22 family protein [Acidobacteriota bacterium]|nr:small ribosomal subunit Rsm22 family protein [Acidobacteriota bacterium]
MQLPSSLRSAIEQELSTVSFSALTTAANELSDRYRQQRKADRFITTEAHRLAYLAVRMPATFAAVSKALAQLGEEFQPESLLDLGAGTGSAAWAAAGRFDSLQRISLVEQDRGLIELGRRLAEQSETLRSANWQAANLRTLAEFAPHDLVICSYALGEIEATAATKILKAAWRATQQVLLIVEPGTTKGFATVRAAREQLIEAGAFLVAPCPHQAACPMPPMGEDETDWCHFAARFDRTSLHRRLKSGSLGYEDEKFSYVAVAKHPVTPATARVLRHPLHHPGVIQLQLCTPDGLQTAKITKRDKEVWKCARKVDWGDELVQNREQ